MSLRGAVYATKQPPDDETASPSGLARMPPEGHRPCREHVSARRHRDDVHALQAVIYEKGFYANQSSPCG